MVASVLSALLLNAALGYVCADWAAAGRFADIEAADAVFEGVVQRIEEDRNRECAPDRVVFKATRVWKGAKQQEYVLLQTAERRARGGPFWITQFFTRPLIYGRGVRVERGWWVGGAVPVATRRQVATSLPSPLRGVPRWHGFGNRAPASA